MAIYTNFDANAGAQRILVKNSAVAIDQACCCGCTTDSDCPSDPDPCSICINGSCTPFVASPSGASTIVEGSTATGSFSTNLPSGTSVTIGVTPASNFFAPTAATRTVSASGSVSFSVTSIDNTTAEGDRFFRFYLIYTKPNGETCTKYSGYWLIRDNDGRVCCCNGQCTLQASATACSNYCGQGGVFHSSRTSCSGIGTLCALGRCCSSGGSCTETTQTGCGGVAWLIYSSCSGAYPCWAPCCVNGTCTLRTYNGCFSLGGTWYPAYLGGGCASVTCPSVCNAPCINRYERIDGQPNLGCGGAIYGSQSISVPSGCNYVTISGSADDQLRITNGGTTFYSPTGNCPGGSFGANNVSVAFQAAASTFQIAAIDHFGLAIGYDITICFSANAAMRAAPRTTTVKGLLSRFGLTAKPTEPTMAAAPAAADKPTGGVGTELKALLARFGILSTPTCSCNARAEEMDRRGVQWCRDNEELIISWMEEEAEKRDLFFMPLFAKLLLWRAIRNAEKKGYG